MDSKATVAQTAGGGGGGGGIYGLLNKTIKLHAYLHWLPRFCLSRFQGLRQFRENIAVSSRKDHPTRCQRPLENNGTLIVFSPITSTNLQRQSQLCRWLRQQCVGPFKKYLRFEYGVLFSPIFDYSTSDKLSRPPELAVYRFYRNSEG